MRSTFKILFYINRQKAKADGKTAIFCRVTIDGRSAVMATGEECLPDEWNSKQGITGEKKINQRLATFRELVEKTYAEMLAKNGVVSAELLKNRLQGVAATPTTLLTMSEAELQSVKACVGKSKAESTYQNLTYSDKLLREFVKENGGRDIPLAGITEDLFENFRFFLKKRGLATSTMNMNKHLCRLSRLMYRAVDLKVIRCHPFEDVTYEKEERKICFLQKSDVAKLMALKVNDREAELARRMFLFSCFTGLAIADMERLKFLHIQTSADGRRYIRKERQKTNVESVVPLHPIAEEILNKSQEEQAVKEEGDDLVFPRDCSRSVMNNKLSTVGKACGVRQRISFHMARHTFGTLSLSAGIPIESIAKMMGHASITSTQIYAQVTDKKISEDMDRLIQKQQAAS